MPVVATAGHVDHGKSALVRALTGIEPDRWEAEKRRGLTIDLGYAWTTLPSGAEVAFVDVPGHQRFIGNMLAGVGPAPAVVLVVAADAGWSRQTAEHLAAADALGLTNGIVVVSRSDLADPAATTEQVLARLAGTSLEGAPVIPCSAVTGAGLHDVRVALDALVASLPAPDAAAPVRLWVDRAFTMPGAGTIVTGTLAEGTIAVGDELELRGRAVRVRGIESMERPHDRIGGVNRVALNLRGVDVDDVRRGDALCSVGRSGATAVADVRLSREVDLPGTLMVHVGTTAVEAHVRPLDGGHVRLSLRSAVPWRRGDRLILRDPGRQEVLSGAVVLDEAPPPLTRRGAASRRAAQLEQVGERIDVAHLVEQEGSLTTSELLERGYSTHDIDAATSGLVCVGDVLVAPDRWSAWVDALTRLVDAKASTIDPFVPLEAARRGVGAPTTAVVEALAEAAGLEVSRGRVARPGARPDLGPAEKGVRALEARLAAAPFDAPEKGDLAGWRLGPRELAAAETAGRLLRLDDGVVLLPDALDEAVRRLATLPQPFTTSQARGALGTTRRVAIPVLERLDREGLTRRIDAGHRELR